MLWISYFASLQTGYSICRKQSQNCLSFGWNSFKGTTKARHQDKCKRSMSYTYVWYSLLSKEIQMKISNFVWNNCFCEIIAFGVYFLRVHIAILRAHIYTLRTYFFISFLVSVGRDEHYSCESRQIITRRRLKMEIIVKSIVEIRTRVNSAAKVSYQQVYSSDLYTSINRRIQTEWPPVSACSSLSQPQNTQKKIQRMVIKLGFLMLRTIVTTFCFWQGPNLRPSAC